MLLTREEIVPLQEILVLVAIQRLLGLFTVFLVTFFALVLRHIVQPKVTASVRVDDPQVFPARFGGLFAVAVSPAVAEQVATLLTVANGFAHYYSLSC